MYAVGNAGVILHRTGSAAGWRREHSGTEMGLSSVWGTGPADVYAVGYAGAVLHFDGRQWTAQDTGTPAAFLAVWGSGPKDVYAVGRALTKNEGVVVHSDGAVWNKLPPLGKGLSAVWGTGPDDVLVAGDDAVGKAGVWRLGSSGWEPQRLPAADRVLAMGGVAGHAAVLGMSGLDTDAGDLIPFGMAALFVMEDHGGAWTRRDLRSISVPVGQTGWGFWGDGKAGATIGGWWGTMGRLDASGLHVNGNATTGKNLFGVWGRSPVDMYAVGVDGMVLRRDSQSWTV